MNDDMYFLIHNSSEQKLYNFENLDLIYPEELNEKYKKPRNGQRLKYIAKERETKKMLARRNTEWLIKKEQVNI